MKFSSFSLIILIIPTLLNSILLQVSQSDYSESNAREYWYYQVMSECNIKRILDWNVPPISTLYPKVTDIQIFYNSTSTGNNLGYIGYNPQTNTVFLSFRGSHENANTWEDIDILKTDYKKCEGCEVHRGFYHAYLDIKDHVLETFIKLCNKYSNAKKVLFGHSLGAAIATFAFIDVYQTVKIDYLYTFGSPRMGNSQFVDFYNKNFPNKGNARITHYKDIIPHLPFEFLGFKHLKGEIFYLNEESSQYMVCELEGEDPKCSSQFSFVATSGGDHTNYFNFDMNVFKVACQS